MFLIVYKQLETWAQNFARGTNLFNVVMGLAASGLRDPGVSLQKKKKKKKKMRENSKLNSYSIISKVYEVEDFDRRKILSSQNDSRVFSRPVCKLLTDFWVSRSMKGIILILMAGLKKVKRHVTSSALQCVLYRSKLRTK